jgi:Spy/CpxP family protein refolding chaperone
MESLRVLLTEMNTNMKANHERLEAKIYANTKAMQEMFRTNQEKMDAWIASRMNDRKETTACHDEMEASIKK